MTSEPIPPPDLAPQPLPEPPPAQVPEPEQVPVPGRCRWCGHLVRDTEIGWVHVDRHGIATTGWLCPMPYMHVAAPRTTEKAQHRRPTPIPRRTDPAEAPSHWPPQTRTAWWEQHR